MEKTAWATCKVTAIPIIHIQIRIFFQFYHDQFWRFPAFDNVCHFSNVIYFLFILSPACRQSGNESSSHSERIGLQTGYAVATGSTLQVSLSLGFSSLISLYSFLEGIFCSFFDSLNNSAAKARNHVNFYKKFPETRLQM